MQDIVFTVTTVDWNNNYSVIVDWENNSLNTITWQSNQVSNNIRYADFVRVTTGSDTYLFSTCPYSLTVRSEEHTSELQSH